MKLTQLNKAKLKISESYTDVEKEQLPFVQLHCLQDKYDSDNFKVYLSLDKDFIASGGIKKLPATALKVLLVIACHTDSNGYSWISQEKIGELLGLSRQQVGKVLNRQLIDQQYGGRTLLKGTKETTAPEKSNCFYNPVNCHLEKIFVDPDQLLYEEDDDFDESMML